MTGDHPSADAMPDRRNVSPLALFLRLAEANRPRLAYRAGVDAQTWKDETLPQVMATLGRLPEPVDPRPRRVASWARDGVMTEHWLIDVEAGLACGAYVNRPADLGDGERRAGILCWHGHGPVGELYGKEPVMGDRSSPGRVAFVDETGSDYGFRMAQAGFVTFAIDWMGHGDLSESRKPNLRRPPVAGDWCDTYYLHATMLGMTPLGMNLAHGRVLVDFATTLPYVDPERLGVMGLSGGGTMALWSALGDERLRAVELICYSQLFVDLAYRDLEHCGSQITPGLLELVDLPDLQALVLPRPLLIDIAAFDEFFDVDPAMACWERLASIYQAAGLEDRIELELTAGGHRWEGRRSAGFFRERLGMGPG